MSPALIVIDLQNDFITPGFALGNKHIKYQDGALDNLLKLCRNFNDQKHPVVFVRSEYTATAQKIHEPERPVRCLERPPGDKYRDVPMNDEHLSSTCVTAFCQPGSEGAEFPSAVQELIDKYSSVVLIKNWYSAFTETELQTWLKEHGVTRGDQLYFAGVTANSCVLASLTDAFFLGYQVVAIQDCIGATSERLLHRAFDKIEKYYGRVMDVEDICRILGLGAAEGVVPQSTRTLYYVNGSIPSWRVMMVLAYKQLPYVAKRLKVMTTPRETRSPEFAALNPRMKTPTLIDEDGTIMIESQAILQYLETFYPDRGPRPLMLSPISSKTDYTRTLQVFHESENAHYVFEDVELGFKGSDMTDTDRHKIAEVYENTLKELKFWEAKLEGQNYVAGDVFSLADCAFYPCLAYMVHRGLQLEAHGLKRLQRYYSKVHEETFAQEACPDGWQTPKKNLFKRAEEISESLRAEP